MSIFGTIYSVLGAALEQATKSIFNNLGVFIDALILPLLALYIAIVGFRIFVLQNLKTDLMSLLRLAIVIPLALTLMNYSVYKEYFVDPIIGLAVNLGYLLVGTTDGKDIFKEVDAVFWLFWAYFNNTYLDRNFLTNAVAILFAGIIVILQVRLYFLLAKYFLLGQLWLFILLSVGIVPLTMLGFRETKHIFFNWIKTTATYFLYIVFAFIIVKFTEVTLRYIHILTPEKEASSTMFMVVLAVTLLLLAEITNQIPNAANAFTGGNAMMSNVGSGTVAGVGGMLDQYGGRNPNNRRVDSLAGAGVAATGGAVARAGSFIANKFRPRQNKE